MPKNNRNKWVKVKKKTTSVLLISSANQTHVDASFSSKCVYLITRHHLVHSENRRKTCLSISTSLEYNQSNLHLRMCQKLFPKFFAPSQFVTFSLSPSITPLGPIQSDLVAGTFRSMDQPLSEKKQM